MFWKGPRRNRPVGRGEYVDSQSRKGNALGVDADTPFAAVTDLMVMRRTGRFCVVDACCRRLISMAVWHDPHSLQAATQPQSPDFPRSRWKLLSSGRKKSRDRDWQECDNRPTVGKGEIPLRNTHPELHLVERIGWLRAAVLGANDGIVSTASRSGPAAASSSSRGAWKSRSCAAVRP